jgi:hypothetical protein
VTRRPPSADATADDYPQLEALFCGYLHQDYPEEHGDIAGALAAFRRDARAPERRAVKKEWKAFRVATDGETLKAIGEKLTRGLGGAWAPRKRADLAALDVLIATL